jgi:RNase H-like domain found in reverse transcriptase/Integrase zinc binding domain
VDASQYALGAILYQWDNNGKQCPVAYHSKTLNEAERGYDIHDCELLAIVWGLENWHHLLMGAKHEVLVFTDHANLQYYRQPHKLNHHVARYIPCLAEYHYKLIHKSGKYNKADLLSCHSNYNQGKDDNLDVTVLPDTLFSHAISLSLLKDMVFTAQEYSEPTLCAWATLHPYMVKHDDCWFYDHLPVVVEDNTLRWEVLTYYHDHLTAGHPGIFNTYLLVSRDYWWPDIKRFIKAYVQGCAICQSTKSRTTKPKIPMFPITTE